ncbi:MAG: substrate-binding domain-containing protein [Lachnospiraceae bacterium]|jgi:GntR family transcriptional regulator of arabinose operon|nr:substrate-binding domain-containing protein [Lachnospiraceae bacterium]MCX4315028.1 GntR family transcriptional regulator [Lachnospiraceae bacterium]
MNTRKNAKYLQIADAIRQNIQSGILPPDSKLAIEDTLMEQYQAGRNTVRHAVALLEKEGLLIRKQGSGTYIRSQKREKTMTIGVMATYLSEYVFPMMIQGIEEETARLGYRFLIRSTRNRIDEERKLLQQFIDSPVDGLIIHASKSAFPNPNLELYQTLSNLNIPFLFLCTYYPNLSAPAVTTDDFQGGYLAAETLIRQGHRHIAGVFKADDITGQKRYAGFLAAMRTYQLEIDDGCIFWYSTGHRKRMFDGSWAEAVYDTVSPASAVICFNDQIAVPLMKLLLQKGKRIPEDIAMISFDNSSLARLAPVPLTSLDYDKQEIGRLAVQTLIGQIEQHDAAPLPPLPFRLVERESTFQLKKTEDKQRDNA